MERVTIKTLLKKLEGIQSIESVAAIMNCSKEKAVYYIYRLRRKGYVKTRKDSKNKRIYHISFENKLGGKSYIDIINESSPIKVTSSQDYKIYGKISLEETLIFAVKSKNLRIILASLALFKKISNWTELYRLSKLNHAKRKVGALYDLSKRIMKTRRMTKRFRKNSLPKSSEKYEFIIPNLKTKDFQKIEKEWRVYLPFNQGDLEEYKNRRPR